MIEKVKIKQLEIADWKKYREFRLNALQKDAIAFGSLYEDEVKFTPKIWKQRLSGKQSINLAAIADNQIIGMIGAYWEADRQPVTHIAYIVSFYVEGKHRKQGIGARLFDKILTFIQKKKFISKAIIFVNTRQHAAYHLYQKFGFRKVGILKKDLKIAGKYYDEYLMEKIFI